MNKTSDKRSDFRTINTVFDTAKFSIDDVVIEDIAEGLCKANRFSGQYKGDHMCSVGQHSVHVSRIIMAEASEAYGGYENLTKKTGKKVARLGLIGLLHDGSESLTGDMPTPYKRFMPDFRKVENKIQDIIYAKFLWKLPSKKELKFLSYVDFRVFNMECQALGRPTIYDPNISGTPIEHETFDDHFDGYTSSGWWDIPTTRARFLSEFSYLSNMLLEYS